MATETTTVVESKTVTGRRQLKFQSMTEILADAEQLVASPSTRMLGNWPLDQLLAHLTKAINGSIDGITLQAPWYVRMAGPLIKKRILKHGMSPGFNLPKDAVAGAFPKCESNQQALDDLRRAIARLETEKMTSPHPVFGPMSHDEWAQLHLRHSEMHLSFAVPA